MNVLAPCPASIVDRETVMVNEVGGDMGNAWLNENSASSGPYEIVSYRPAELIRLTAYDDFFKGAAKVKSLIIKHVAEAARYLVDDEGMTNSIKKGQVEVHQTFWPKGFPGSYDETPYTYDLEKAKSILSDAGIESPITVTPYVINQMTMDALTETDPEKRLGMYVELQQRVQENSPIVIMFQATYQVAMGKSVSGYVNGATSDLRNNVKPQL